MLRMEDGAKENTALNIQKPLEILVTDEDKHGTDIACMSDFFGIYIEQLSAELSNQVMRGVVEKIPAADVQILGELVHGVDVLLSGKYGYIPDFDSLPNDVKDKLKKGIYTLGESRQVEDNVRAVVLDENGTRIKDVTLKRVLNTPDTLEMSRSITSQVQMRQIAAKLDEIAETQSYLIEMERNNNIIMYQLTDQQFREVVAQFQYFSSREKRKSGSLKVKRLAINVLSINTNKGLYVLAYRNLNLDVKNHIFKPDEEITVCTQFSIDGKQENARKFLDADEYELLEDFEKNLEKIKDAITEHGGNKSIVDDMPYVIGLGMDVVLNLHEEYKAIMDMFEADNVTYPIKAFFGELLERPRRTKAYPIALINKNINLDQLLAINNAMKYPLAYIQGPPGTGKTNTIINTIVTAFFNNVTVLFSSELPEIINMCDNVCVIRAGKLVGKLGKDQMNQEEIMKYAAGGVE